jgi:ABC-2 type transport system ATP-binding protein
MLPTNSAENAAIAGGPSNSAENAAIAGGPSAGPAAAAMSEAGAADPDDRSPRPMASPAIHTVGLSKRFGDTIAVRSLSITVERGEVFGFLGPNGAGKTTVVKLLLGLASPSGGEALVLGAPLGDREARRRIGYLPELFRFQALLTATEVLRLHCRLLALPRETWKAQTRRALEIVGLLERGDDRVGTFSKGMQQRLGLGVALLGDPALVVLDEPTSALDPVGRHDVREIIRGLRGRGATVFLNTHLLEEAEHVCDRVAVIDKGAAIATGTLGEMLGRHSRVRLKVSGLAEDWWSDLGRFGRWHREQEWAVVEGIDPPRIADLVDAVVALGGRVGAVIPEQQSLEARFLELLSER